MQDIGDEKQAKDFMIIRKRRFLQIITSVLLGAVLVCQMSSCDPDLTDDEIPVVPFADISINLNLPQYAQDLSTDGGSTEIDGGVRGIIIHRENSSTYLAFEKNCSYHPNEACATVEVHSSTLYMIDVCCESTFRFSDGEPTSGVAWRPLRRYVTLLTGSTLTVTSDIQQ